jgi:predicted Zn-dependent protease
LRNKPASLFVVVLLILALFVPVTARAQSKSPRFIRDAEIENTIRAYATPLFQAAGLSPQDINIYLIEDRALNAFVTGGLYMFIHTGLLMNAKDPLEVIGVIAHETGHIVGGHIISRGIETENALIKVLATQLVGIGVAIAAGRPEAAAAASLGGQDLALKGLLSFSRAQEQAADQTAIRLLDATEQSPTGIVELLRSLQDQEVLLAASQDPYLRTHPLTQERVDFAERALRESPYADTPASAELVRMHQRMRAKLIGFLDPPLRVFQTYPEQDNSVPARYARAIASYRVPDLDMALPLIDGLLAELPDDPYFHELKGQMLFENGRLAEALPSYESAVKLLPQAPQLRLALAHVQIELNDRALDRKALDHLETVLRHEPNSGFAWRLSATAYDRLGDDGMKYLALSEESLSRGRLLEAHKQAGRAQELLPDFSPAWLRAQDVANLAKSLQSKKKK